MFSFYYLRYLNLITHKALSVGVEITVSPLFSRDKLGHLYSNICSANRKMIQRMQELQRVWSH